MTMQLDCLQIAKAAGLEQGKTSGKEILFHCSRHPDEHPSLSIHPETDKWFCGPCGKGGGAWQLAAFLSGHDLFEKGRISAWLREHGVLDGEGENKRPPTRKYIAPGIETAVYSYRDENGKELFQVVRYEPKTFRQRRPDGKGGYTWKLDGVRRVLYRLPELSNELRAKPAGERLVYVVEGEKDVEALRTLGLSATTNAAGANKWRPEYTEQLHAAGVESVVLLPDNDEAGKSHALSVAQSCFDAAIEVKIVNLPGLPPKGDVSDFLSAGHRRAELEKITCATAAMTETDLGAAGNGAKGSKARFTPEPSRLVSDLLPALRGVVPDDHILPRPYSVYESKIFVQDNDGRMLLTQTPFFPVHVKHSADESGRTSITLAILERGNVRTVEVEAPVLFSHQKIVNLTNAGIQLNSLQARDCVRYVTALQQANRIPTSLITKSFGLRHPRGQSAYAYLLGPTRIGHLQVSFEAISPP